MEPYFLNVDLEIESRSKLDLLEQALGERVIVLHSGPIGVRKHLLAVENSWADRKGPDATIHALCAIIELLSPQTRRQWANARKTFDVGYELRLSERSLRFTLRADTIQRIAALGATLTVTCYRADENESSDALIKPSVPKRATRMRRKKGVH